MPLAAQVKGPTLAQDPDPAPTEIQAGATFSASLCTVLCYSSPLAVLSPAWRALRSSFLAGNSYLHFPDPTER